MSMRRELGAVLPTQRGRRSARLDAVLRAGQAHTIATIGSNGQERMPSWLLEAQQRLEQDSDTQLPILRARIRTLEAQVLMLDEQMDKEKRECAECDEALEKAADDKKAMIENSGKRQQELLMELQDLENRLRLSGNEYNKAIVTERDLLKRQVASFERQAMNMQRKCDEALEKAADDKKAMIENSGKRQQELLMELQDLENRLRLSGNEYNRAIVTERDLLRRQVASLERQAKDCTNARDRLVKLEQMIAQQEAFVQGMFPSWEE